MIQGRYILQVYNMVCLAIYVVALRLIYTFAALNVWQWYKVDIFAGL